MKKLFLIITIISVSLAAYSQNNYIKTGSIGKTKPEQAGKKEDKFLYGPVKFRELAETIGETYLILPLSNKSDTKYSFIYKGTLAEHGFELPAEEGPGKLIVLKSFDKEIAYFKDSIGNDYSAKTADGHIYDIISIYDLERARNLFLNKTLWMNKEYIRTFDSGSNTYGQIKNLRFEPVKVTDIVASSSSTRPIRFILETKNKKVGFADVIVSGTNYNLRFLIEFMFETIFFTKDPKVTYKFTPAMWAKIKNHETEIGMTTDQVRLSRGRPDEINSSTDPASADQWVYGNSYLYFRNGKLSSISNY